MKILLYFFLSTIILLNFSYISSTSNYEISDIDKPTLDTSSIAILQYDTVQNNLYKNSHPSQLTEEDILVIDSILKSCIKDYNIMQENKYQEWKENNPKSKYQKDNFVIDLKKYKRQYIAHINEKGEKEVWVNCFCNAFDKNWRKEIIIVEDGGNCYFNVLINLKSKDYFDFEVNGSA